MTPAANVHWENNGFILPSPKPFTAADEAHLREILKRCSAATCQAACQFRKTGHFEHLPVIVLGIIERYVESDRRPRLKPPQSELCLAEDLGIDSLTMMEIVMLTEDVLQVSIHNDELRQLRTLGEVRHFIEGKLGGMSLQEQRAG